MNGGREAVDDPVIAESSGMLGRGQAARRRGVSKEEALLRLEREVWGS
jgi:hypothetical protein